ncbi:MAG: hypothetical protein V1659_04160 [Candidatus Woesearchaeota archaeon]
MTNIYHNLKFNDPHEGERFRFYADASPLQTAAIPQLLAEGRHIIKPETVLERRINARQVLPVIRTRQNWQNVGTYSTLVGITSPAGDIVRIFNSHPVIETINENSKLTPDGYLETTEQDFYFNGAQRIDLSKEQVAILQRGFFAFPKKRMEFWIEVAANGDERLFNEYLGIFKTTVVITKRPTFSHSMDLNPTLAEGLRFLWLGPFTERSSDVYFKEFNRDSGLFGDQVQGDDSNLCKQPSYSVPEVHTSERVPAEKRVLIPSFSGIAVSESEEFDDSLVGKLHHARQFLTRQNCSVAERRNFEEYCAILSCELYSPGARFRRLCQSGLNYLKEKFNVLFDN